jgi:hypothetical protein
VRHSSVPGDTAKIEYDVLFKPQYQAAIRLTSAACTSAAGSLSNPTTNARSPAKLRCSRQWQLPLGHRHRTDSRSCEVADSGGHTGCAGGRSQYSMACHFSMMLSLPAIMRCHLRHPCHRRSTPLASDTGAESHWRGKSASQQGRLRDRSPTMEAKYSPSASNHQALRYRSPCAVMNCGTPSRILPILHNDRAYPIFAATSAAV